MASVTRLLDSGVNHLEADASGRTALHWAVTQHHLEVAEKLLAHHRHPASPVSMNRKLKWLASQTQPVRKLLGIPPSSSSTRPTQIHTLTYDKLKHLASRVRPIITPIELAAQVEDEAIFRLLLENLEPFADAAVLFNGAWPPAPSARDLRVDPSSAELFHSDHLPSEDYANWTDWWIALTGLIVRNAIMDGKLAVADMVLRVGANPEGCYGVGSWGPLHIAALYQQDPAFIRLLLKYGADCNSDTNFGNQTSLYNEAAVSALLEAGASPNTYGDPRYNSHLR